MKICFFEIRKPFLVVVIVPVMFAKNQIILSQTRTLWFSFGLMVSIVLLFLLNEFIAYANL